MNTILFFKKVFMTAVVSAIATFPALSWTKVVAANPSSFKSLTIEQRLAEVRKQVSQSKQIESNAKTENPAKKSQNDSKKPISDPVHPQPSPTRNDWKNGNPWNKYNWNNH